MTDTSAMTHHGIMTSRAQYWVHLHPLDAAVYWYSASVCRKFIQRKSLPNTMGNSKDGTQHTGAGYLIEKDAYFVHRVRVPPKFLESYDWTHFTDREAGLAGQDVVEALVDAEILIFPIRTVQFLSGSDQYAGCDMRIDHYGMRDFEVKCERVKSGNLFVQTHERGHRPHTGLAADGKPETRITSWDKS